MGVLQEITDLRSNPEVDTPKVEDAMVEFNGTNNTVITTKGWDVKVRWKDQSTDWVPFKLVK